MASKEQTPEATLAWRIGVERERRGLSYEALAKLMTDAGCRIHGSAIYKIEKASPPRKITVDELVALASVFNVEVSDLLRPREELDNEYARELVDAIREDVKAFRQIVLNTLDTSVRLLELAQGDRDLYGYVVGHVFAGTADDVDDAGTDDEPVVGIAAELVARLEVDFRTACLHAAGDMLALDDKEG